MDGWAENTGKLEAFRHAQAAARSYIKEHELDPDAWEFPDEHPPLTIALQGEVNPYAMEGSTASWKKRVIAVQREEGLEALLVINAHLYTGHPTSKSVSLLKLEHLLNEWIRYVSLVTEAYLQNGPSRQKHLLEQAEEYRTTLEDELIGHTFLPRTEVQRAKETEYLPILVGLGHFFWKKLQQMLEKLKK
ncbi:MAG: hypothetical protein Q7R81_00665 [Candidatus Peregrinibacteria bacterium]|nr:hypothetical protein [Candidatus Peregrinibacteria bacterium]